MQSQSLTPGENRILSRNRLRRFFLTFALIFLIFFVIVDLAFLLGTMRDSEVPEWVLIPFVLGIVAAGLIIGIASYMTGKLKVVEKARFVRASIRGRLESRSTTKRNLANTLSKIAGALINNSSGAVAESLVREGWPETRARYLTGLIESLMAKCEWDIDYEGRITWFSQLLKQNRWPEDEVALIISPVQELIKKHGGRLTRSGIARSIARNVLWIIITLIMAPILAWMLLTTEDLDDQIRYDFIKYLLVVIPGLCVLIYNLIQIARRRRRGK